VTRYAQFCALARAAELLGKRWNLLILRDLLLGPRRFTDLRAGLDGVSTSVLAQRLADLERDQLVRRSEMGPPVAGPVYELTEHGAALRPAIYELIRWGGRFLLPPRRGERFHPQWLLLALSASARRHDAPGHTLQLLVTGEGAAAAIHIAGGPEGTTVEAGEKPAELTIRGEARTVFEVLTGMKKPAEVPATSRLRLDGDERLLELAPRFFASSSGRAQE
jgi:DNA-binding HxlR family transcriptional regulator